MKRLFTFWMLALLPFCISAQTDTKAAEVLDKVLEDLSKSSGIRAEFGGSETGFLLLKGEKFYLNNGNIQSWYDGKTQWSYVADTEEVNISHPTLYKGSRARNGVKGHEIILIPKHSEQTEIIRVFVSTTYQPLAMRMEQNGHTLSEINITSYKINQKLEDGMFKFNRSLFPNAEIIDMR